jgi:glycosyltransferase involved in cell wall biosynthesis
MPVAEAPAAPLSGVPGQDEITLVVAQSPRYYPHVDRHLQSLRKVFRRVRLLYWEKDPAEPLHGHDGVEVHRVVIPFGAGGTLFFARLMAAFTLRLLRLRPCAVEAIDPYALIPARLASLRFPCRIAYFSMEYFPGLPSLLGKPVKRAAWRALERWAVARAASVATVCDSIAVHLKEDFRRERVLTVRNVPELSHAADTGALHARCGLPTGARIVLYQGMLQTGRGLEAAVDAIAGLPSLHLALVGPGPLAEGLRVRARAAGCADRVHLLGEVPSRDLAGLTPGAFAGLAPFQALSPSYLYSLPGKLFEYIQAGVPVVASDLPEIRRIVEGYQVGYCVAAMGPEGLASALRSLSEDAGSRGTLEANLAKAKADLCWEEEEKAYLELFR